MSSKVEEIMEEKTSQPDPEPTLRSDLFSLTQTSQIFSLSRSLSNWENTLCNSSKQSSHRSPADRPVALNYGEKHPNSPRKLQRLKAGQDASYMRPTLFQRGVYQKRPHNFYKEDVASNWGLHDNKVKNWQNDEEFAAHPTSTYSRSFKWWTKDGKERKEPTPRIEKKETEGKICTLPVRQLTVKDWQLRGKKSQLLPIPWSDPEPRFPSQIVRDSYSMPDVDRWREINARLARTSYEVQHPTEKWAANLYLG